MSIKCLIFDMDATLIDSEIALSNTINEIRADMKLPKLDSKVILDIINNPTLNPIIKLYGVTSISHELKNRFEKLFNANYFKYAKIYDEAHEIILWAKDKMKLAVATNAMQSSVDLILKKLNLSDNFDFIIGSSALIPQKPDPTMLNIIKDKIDGECVFFGDSKKDYLAAINAKMHYIQVLWGRNEINEKCKNCKTSQEVIEYLKKF